MVQLFVSLPDDGNSSQEWAMIELQGSLETRQPVPLSGKFVGDLHFTQQKDVPILIIGHHILYGKCMELEKPFAVLVKNSTSNIEESAMNMDKSTNSEESSMDTEKSHETSYKVKAIIRKKLLFKQRPKPIIANVPKKL